MKSVELMDTAALNRALTRIAHEIVENNDGTNGLAFVGICNRGVPIAHRLANIISQTEGIALPVGKLDISFYRDDLNNIDELKNTNPTDVPFDIDGKYVVLVDDVLYTGRTARAAIDAIMDMGRPRIVRFAVLIDRGHRELPICADFVGKHVPTARSEHVNVRLSETDGIDEVVIN